MNLQCHGYGAVALIDLPARMVMANAPETRSVLKELISGGRTRLVLNLQPVKFVDSSGLSVLVSALKAVQAENGEVVLLSPDDGVRSLIELTRLHQVFEIFEDRQAAIERLS